MFHIASLIPAHLAAEPHQDGPAPRRPRRASEPAAPGQLQAEGSAVLAERHLRQTAGRSGAALPANVVRQQEARMPAGRPGPLPRVQQRIPGLVRFWLTAIRRGQSP